MLPCLVYDVLGMEASQTFYPTELHFQSQNVKGNIIKPSIKHACNSIIQKAKANPAWTTSESPSQNNPEAKANNSQDNIRIPASVH